MLADGAGKEAETCTIAIDGTKYDYLFKTDGYFGKFEISIDERTRGEKSIDTMMKKGNVSFLTYWGEEEGYMSLGYFVSSGDMQWVYIRLKTEDGASREIVAPAENEAEALQIKQRAAETMWEAVLPAF